MLTVKVIDGYGNENIYQSRNVFAKTEKSENSRRITAVYFRTEDNSELEIQGEYALVYVMNENGKTVADYIVGAGKEIPERN